MKDKALHTSEAFEILKDRQPHKLRLWKISTGDILTYPQAVLIGRSPRYGNHRVRLLPSKEIREFRDVTLFEIDDMKIYL